MLMNADLDHRLNYEIVMLENARKEYLSRLDHLHNYKGSCLRMSKPGKGKYRYYYIKRPGSRKYSYISPSDQHEVDRVREVRFLEEAIRRIDRDIALMKELADGFLPYDPSHISESLPAIYRCEVPPVSELYKREGAAWKAEKLKRQKEFPENYPEKKKHRTSDGVMVKTASELTLYEMCKAAGLSLVYEMPLPMKDYGPPLYPDLTALSPIDIKTEIIIEYVGLLDLREYREGFARKVERYIKCGYTPGVNLFFVFSDRYGNVDALQITKVIADIFGIRNFAI